jgi:mono/diheme cytochrome c family protein
MIARTLKAISAAAFVVASFSALAQDAAPPAAAPATAEAQTVSVGPVGTIGVPADPGEYLARAGNCVACHSVPNAKAFTGGLKMMTPLGAIYTTNITPDPETGIGNYTLEDFDKAVRLGVAKDGHRLYPAMPYPSYAKLTDADVKALYDYFMKSVPAAKRANQPSEIPWPLNLRWPLAVWNVLFFDDKPYADKAGKDAAWNRGAYLVQGLGHCGACHTPRGIAFNEKAVDETKSGFLVGAPLDNWSAPNLTQAVNTGLGRWSEADIAQFMKVGHNGFGTAFGTMTEVINNSTQYMTDTDLAAMATYLKSLPAAHDQGAPYAYDEATESMLRAGSKPTVPGAVAYIQRCKSCHAGDGKGYAPYLPPLAGNPAVLDPDGVGLINITLNGSARIVVAGMPDAYRMPQFRALMTDQEVADVVNFMRTSWGNKAGTVSAGDVAKVRAETNPSTDRIEVLRMK